MTTTTVEHAVSAALDSAKPTTHSQRVMRQTQAVMGVILLAGTAAAYFHSINWLIIPAFMGCGLLVAGGSGLCPMASLLARMPWNRGKAFTTDGGCCGGTCK
ncbi:MAG: DUF2892 domain-containing protein [Phycisphaerales bacterium]|nr:DUF2892 domain-containing protein [Phycisphaerales bacterium]